jgi:exosome complex component RRP43
LADIIQNSGVLDLKDLCISKEKLAWVLYCDIVCLDHDGCVLDAAVTAIISALQTVRLPDISYDKDTKLCEINEEAEKVPLKIKNVPVSTSFAIFDQFAIADPTSEEENLAASIVTVTVTNSSLSYVAKAGGVSLTPEKLEQCIETAKKREKSVCQLVKVALGQ